MRFLPILLALLLPGSLLADSDTPTYNRIAFTEQADADVDNDLLVAVMFVQREGRRADRLAAEVNALIDTAVDKVKKIPEIAVQTQSYRTTAVYKNNAINGWRVNQSIRLESRNSQLLGDTIGELQSSLNVQSISYQVSEDSRREHTNKLVETALQRFQQRAKAVARTMGGKNYRLVRININSGQGSPLPMRSEMMMADAGLARAAVPARIEAGTQRISVSVSGEIELID